ncbi:aldo/keto reductase [Devosia sp. MC532]|uniref:aldo/keto reductase n=1 Tax=Devosia sp. MC532 TaxID=2799788 RepID=UPI0018F289DD|nr:aldo/keto reductase [Devosia sp. MC532]MBJ7576269.1 aldo/keto reductase [Devosia sp. MC532]
MNRRSIGSTGVEVSEISMGCASIGNLAVAISDEQAQQVLQLAWDRGVRYFDTAPRYGSGRSEARLGQFLAGKPRDQFAVSTKVGRVLTPGPQRAEAYGFIDPLPNDVHYDYTAAGIEKSLRGSRERLGLEKIDIVLAHDIGTYMLGAEHNPAHMRDFLESGLPYLAELKAKGLVGAYGLGVNETEVCLELLQDHALDVILLAGRWTLLDRKAEAELVPLCREKGTKLVLGGVFNSGILAVGPKPGAWFDYAPASPDLLQQVAELENRFAAAETGLAHAALQFALTRPQDVVASVLLGGAELSNLKKNLDLLAKPLSNPARHLLG